MGLFGKKKEVIEVKEELFLDTLQKLVINKILYELYLCKTEMLSQIMKFKKTNYDLDNLDELVDYIPVYISTITNQEELNNMLDHPDEVFMDLYDDRYENQE